VVRFAPLAGAREAAAFGLRGAAGVAPGVRGAVARRIAVRGSRGASCASLASFIVVSGAGAADRVRRAVLLWRTGARVGGGAGLRSLSVDMGTS
jgi:hypothetical protein